MNIVIASDKWRQSDFDNRSVLAGCLIRRLAGVAIVCSGRWNYGGVGITYNYKVHIHGNETDRTATGAIMGSVTLDSCGLLLERL